MMACTIFLIMYSISYHYKKKIAAVERLKYLNVNNNCRKIPIISPGLMFVQKAFLLGLFSGELIFGEAYYWKDFCVLKWFALDNNNGLKHQENSLKQLIVTVHGVIFEGAYYRKDICV